jgi:hypothetical protein
MCGSNPNTCDVLLGRAKDLISAEHFYITLDEQERLVLRDTSKHGMTVSYDGQGALQPRNHFTWILFREFKTITVTIADDTLKFEIQLARHETCEAEYRARVASYLSERQDAELQLGQLNIYSQESTAAATQALSPRQRPIYRLLEKIGSGTSGKVYRALDVSTGEIYAAKAYKDDCEFEKEVEIHRKVSHVSFSPIPPAKRKSYRWNRSILCNLQTFRTNSAPCL